MRKDYIAATEPTVQEAEFVQKYWTAVWESEGGPKGRLDRISSCDEYRFMAPYIARLPDDARLLDGGCGLGDWTLYFARKGYSVVGLDLSSKTVMLLQERFSEAVFIEGDIRKTNFPDESFDAYLSWGVFEHFEAGLQDCVQEAFRIVRPGGLLFISVPHDNLRHAMLGSLSRPRDADGPLRFYQWRLTRAELARELQIGGFEVLDVKPISKRQGVLRSLHHEFGLPYDSFITKALSVILAPLIPGSLISHMVIAVARKPFQGPRTKAGAQ